MRMPKGASTLIFALLIAMLPRASFARDNHPEYLVTSGDGGIYVSTVTSHGVTAVEGSPFSLNPFGSGGGSTPLQLAFNSSGDFLYALYYTGTENLGVASFYMNGGTPQLVGSVGGISFLSRYSYFNNLMAVGTRFVFIAQSILFGNGDLQVVETNQGALKFVGQYILGGNAVNIVGYSPLGIQAPLSLQVSDDDRYAYITYQNTYPDIAGVWSEKAARGTTASMVISNGKTGGFSYSIANADCTMAVSGNLTESGGQLSGTGTYSQSGAVCGTNSSPATFSGTVTADNLTLVTSAAGSTSTSVWEKVISPANGQSLFGNCAAVQCVAIYDISGLPSAAPKLIQTLPESSGILISAP